MTLQALQQKVEDADHELLKLEEQKEKAETGGKLGELRAKIRALNNKNIELSAEIQVKQGEVDEFYSGVPEGELKCCCGRSELEV